MGVKLGVDVSVTVGVLLGVFVCVGGTLASAVGGLLASKGAIAQPVSPPKMSIKKNTAPRRNRVCEKRCILEDNFCFLLFGSHGIEGSDTHFDDIEGWFAGGQLL